MFDWFIRKTVRETVEKTVRETIQEKLPGIVASRIEPVMTKIFTDQPNVTLKPVGFSWAFYLALRRRWPTVTRGQTDLWGQEYMGVTFGTEGFEWTPAAAEELARSYAQEFGEAA